MVEFRRLRREEFEAHILAIQAAEVGTARALGAAFGAKVGPLPHWEDLDSAAKEEEEPEWIHRYKQANLPPTPIVD